MEPNINFVCQSSVVSRIEAPLLLIIKGVSIHDTMDISIILHSYFARGMRPQIVLLGDSITERGFVFQDRGWGLQIAGWYGVRADVLNRGHSGYTTRIAMELMEERKEGWYHIMEKEAAAALVVIFWGANDAAQFGIQGIPLSEYKERLGQQIKKIRACGEAYAQRIGKPDPNYTKVIIVTPPPVDNDAWLKEVKQKYKATNPSATEEELNNLVLDRNLATTGLFAEVAREVAIEYQCPLIDLYKQMQQEPPGEGKTFADYFNDGLHFSPHGNNFMFSQLKKTIKKAVPELVPTSIPKDFLEWRDAIQQSNKHNR